MASECEVVNSLENESDASNEKSEASEKIAPAAANSAAADIDIEMVAISNVEAQKPIQIKTQLNETNRKTKSDLNENATSPRPKPEKALESDLTDNATTTESNTGISTKTVADTDILEDSNSSITEERSIDKMAVVSIKDKPSKSKSLNESDEVAETLDSDEKVVSETALDTCENAAQLNEETEDITQKDTCENAGELNEATEDITQMDISNDGDLKGVDIAVNEPQTAGNAEEKLSDKNIELNVPEEEVNKLKGTNEIDDTCEKMPSSMEIEDDVVFEAELKEAKLPELIDLGLEDSMMSSNEIASEQEGDIYYNKDCLNCNCKKESKQYIFASMANLNYFKVPRKANKRQYICLACHDLVIAIYEKHAGLLVAKQPLLLHPFQQDDADFVALDSSDEEDHDNESEKGEFSLNDLNLIENELEDAIQNVLGKVQIENQIAWSKSILQAKSDRLLSAFDSLDAELSVLQSMADKMHSSLYNSNNIVHKQLPPLDLYQQSGYDYVQVPPAGEIERPPIELHETYYAVKTKAIASWVSIKVIEFVENTAVGGNTVKSYKIKYLNTPYQMVKTVTAKHIAYFQPPPVRLTIGTRVIAFFDGTTLTRGKEKSVVQSAFYPGIIAEPLKQANRFRYLIFYDDGYTQYVQHKDVRLVCLASDKVWEDVHPASRDFIQKYVEKYSVDRPMVQCTRGQSMNTESNGTWLYARVIDIDCSLVLMQFEGDKNHTEWIYRGSLRLGPVFKETQNALNSANAIQQQTRVPRRTEPFIRYTKEMEVSNMQVNQKMRAIARKSSSMPQTTATTTPTSSTAAATAAASRSAVRHLNNSTIYVDDENRPKGHVVYFTAKRNLPPKVYTHHDCSPNCLFKIIHRLDSYSPLAKPLLSGWERLVMRQKIKRSVVYRGPCGKSLRNLAEVHMYLRATDNVLNVENFDFTPDLHCLAEYSIDPTIVKEGDISKGQEKMAIPLVNYYDNTLPPPCTYAKQRIPTEGVNLNLDKEFLVGCDCEDDCSDKSKCSCWQLTVEGVKYCNPNKPIDEIGYQYKRLHEHVPTGIYECNSRCKCKKNCLNRVVQHSLEMKLQVFKTSNRGWGLRCVNDIPKGAFICIYAGHLLTETMANEGGLDAGDEYFADLDYIEVAEQLKEGFESDVEHSDFDGEEDTYVPDEEDDDDFTPKKSYNPRPKNKIRASRSNSTQNNELDSQERAVINFNPNADLDETVRENSVRRLFGKDEAPYIMDAKTTGNLGRYFNHSCAPNLFVQNVFVDTHDLRFPWVAFFSANHIRSGTELTWNYNYEVGVVPGKVLYCQCGATNCRIRLL